MAVAAYTGQVDWFGLIVNWLRFDAVSLRNLFILFIQMNRMNSRNAFAIMTRRKQCPYETYYYYY